MTEQEKALADLGARALIAALMAKNPVKAAGRASRYVRRLTATPRARFRRALIDAAHCRVRFER